MKTICVLQHVEAEYLGLMEDHFESRNIRFVYVRPFTPGGIIPPSAEGYDGLIVLGAGPLGIVSSNLIPSFSAELRLARDFIARGLPVTGIGIGSAIVAVAAGGGAEEAPLRFTIETARRAVPDALGGHLPEVFPLAVYMRDRPVLPEGARILATNAAGEPLVFALGGNCLGFLGHPGMKSGMVEDLIMEFTVSPDDPAGTLERLRAAQGEIAEALGEIMVGLVDYADLM